MENRKIDSMLIWVYLDGGEDGFHPAFYELCLDSISKHIKGAEISLVSIHNIHDFLPGLKDEIAEILQGKGNPARTLSLDFIQASLLEQFGGLWIRNDVLIIKEIGNLMDPLKQFDFVCSRDLDGPHLTDLILTRHDSRVIREYRSAVGKELKHHHSDQSWQEKRKTLLQGIMQEHERNISFFEEAGIRLRVEKEPLTFFRNTAESGLKDFLRDDPSMIPLHHLTARKDNLKSMTFPYWSKEKILNEDILISALFRMALRENYTLNVKEQSHTVYYQDIAIIVQSIERNDSLLRFIRSTQKYFPGLSVYIALQGDDPGEEFNDLSGMENIHLYLLPNDYGISACRNFLIKKIHEKYIFLCDDDFEFTADTNLKAAYDIITAVDNVKIVGGLLLNCNYNDHDEIINRQYASMGSLIMDGDFSDNKEPVIIPTEYLTLEKHYLNPEDYYVFCDCVSNFALIDKSIFEQYNLWWDEKFKIRGEHLDFYLRVKELHQFRVVFTNALYSEHHRKTNPVFSEMRYRPDGQIDMMEKWNFYNLILFGRRTVRIFRRQFAEVTFRESFRSGDLETEKIRLEDINAQIKAAEKEIRDIKSSKSWHISAPLRHIYPLIRKLNIQA